MDRRSLLKIMLGAAAVVMAGPAIGVAEAAQPAPAPLPENPAAEKQEVSSQTGEHLDENGGEYAQYYRRRVYRRRYYRQPVYRRRVYRRRVYRRPVYRRRYYRPVRRFYY